VNFLLHFELARREEADGDDQVALGATLPDLYRMVSRRMRTRSSERFEGSLSLELGALQRGIDHHLEADHWFHRTSVFGDGERELARDFAAIGAHRLPLFAHAAWEMCLDGAWLRRDGGVEALDSLSRVIGTERERVHLLALAHGAPTGPEHAFTSRLDRLLDVVATGALPLGYAHARGLAQRTSGMRASFGLPLPSEQQQRALESALEDALHRADEALPRLLDDRKGERARA
jgi:hypothetical protein